MSDNTYQYKGIDANGKQQKGTIQANSESQAYQKAVSKGLSRVKIEHKAETVMNKDIQIPGFESKAKLKSLVIFTKQFALMTRAGMPMIEAVNISSAQTEDAILKAALIDVEKDITKGISLSASMRKHPRAFPGLLTSVVSVGEEGGFLDESMMSMSKTYQTELELKQRIKSAMTYPIIVVSVTLLILTAMLIFVIPIFAEMFINLGADLPAITQMLVTASDNAIIIIPIMVVLIIGLMFFFRYFKDEEWLKSRVDMFALKVLVFGPLNTKTAIARFSRNLSMMIGAGVPLTNALRLVSTTSSNYHIEHAIDQAVINMERGGSLSGSMSNFTMFPLMVTQMISVGERSGSLEEMLDSIGDFYEVEVKEASDKLASSLEPILLVVLGGLVGFMLFALYMPMFSLFVEMSGG